MRNSNKLQAAEAARELLARRRARLRLIDFAQYVDRGAAQWYAARHLAQIADVLERVDRGEIARVIISTPPRHWKSSLVSEKFPAWYLGRNPSKAVIVASYALSLAEKFSRSVRDAFATNPNVRALFPDVRLRGDATRVDDWSLTDAARSSFRAVGVGGGITGFGANLIVIDDPISDYQQAQSQAQRDSLWEWYRSVLRTRLESGGAIVLVQTRWHEDDLAGRLIRAQSDGGEQWHIVNLPALDADGNPLWAERFSADELSATRAAIGEYAWRSLYLGNPSADEGQEIKREWFDNAYFPALPDGAQWRVRAWDLALTEKQIDKPNPDYTASVKATTHNGDIWLGEPRLYRRDWASVVDDVMGLMMQESTITHGTGKALHETAAVQSLIRKGFNLTQYPERGDKRTRAMAWVNQARLGKVKLVGTRSEWEQFLAQWYQFPSGAHDDAVDATSGAAQMLGLVFETHPTAPRKVQVSFG